MSNLGTKQSGAIPFRVVLAQYHERLMEIRQRYRNAENSYPGQKDAAAKEAGADFAALVGDFDAKFGAILRQEGVLKADKHFYGFD
jgi:hypothetical protein